jgi:hypothetical protein
MKGFGKMEVENKVAIAFIRKGMTTVINFEPLTSRSLQNENSQKGSSMKQPLINKATCSILAFALAGLLAACNSPGTAPMNANSKKDAIEYKQNPNPKRAYRIVMEVENAPGPFAVVQGAAQYDVTNEEGCGEFRAMAGGYNREVNHVALQWERLSDTSFATTVYADLMLDEDYFGRGPCRWKFTHANASLSATGAKDETMFQPDITAEEIESKQTAKWFHWKGYYPRSEHGDFVDYGHKVLDRVPSERRGEFFAVILTATELKP